MMRTHRVLILAPIIVVFFSTFVVLTLWIRHRVDKYYRENTEFSAQYSENAFHKIVVGDSIYKIEDLLGPPLLKLGGPRQWTYWYDSLGGGFVVNDEDRVLEWRSLHSAAQPALSPPINTRDDFVRVFGTPNRVSAPVTYADNPNVFGWIYSRPRPAAENYDARELIVNTATGKVLETVAERRGD